MLEKLARQFDVPNDVAECLSMDMDSLADNMFADSRNRRYPIFSKAATVASLTSYALDYDSLPPGHRDGIADILGQAVTHYGITEPLHKKASGKVDIMVQHGADVLNLSVTPTKDGLDKAANLLLYTIRPENPYELCKQAALELYKVAHDHDIAFDPAVSERVERLAGLAMGDQESTVTELRKRAYSLLDTPKEEREVFKTLCHTFTEMSKEAAESPDTMHKLASILDTHDFNTGRHSRYNLTAAPPEEALFGHTLSKFAAELEDSVTINSLGTVISKTDVLEKRAAVEDFLCKYGLDTLIVGDPDEALLMKVASLNAVQAAMLLDHLQE